jgi:hypothetical protein
MLKQISYACGLLISLSVIQSASAATSTFSFDEFANGTTLTTQYQSRGVLVSGATVLDASTTAIPAHSAPNIAYAPTGLMTFSLDSSVVGSIKTVSAYVSGDPNTGIYAYDSSNNLVGQAVLGNRPNNTLLTVTSTGNPIVNIQIHDGGSNFTIDDLSLTSVPVCADVTSQFYNAAAALPDSAFKFPKTAGLTRGALLKLIDKFAKDSAKGASSKQLLQDLNFIDDILKNCLKPSAAQTNLLNLYKQLIALTKANQC